MDSLLYIDDYLDVIEALQLDLQKNFTLLKEMDGYAQESVMSTAQMAIELIDNIDSFEADVRFEKLQHLVDLLTETSKRTSEKAALAKVTFEAVERHCNRLDADLVKFEETNTTGNIHIVSLPGLTPSSKSLVSRLSSSKDAFDQEIEKRDLVAKKRRKEDVRLKPANGSSNKTKTWPRRKNTKLKSSDTDMSIDPNEPLYCYCQQVSFGEMVACDNADCEIEWFHIACVDLKTVPKGKWYCDNFIIEQVNPLESTAVYDLKVGHTTFHEFILSYPRGAYTGMRTLHRNAIVEFDAHIKRLTQSLSLIHWDHDDTTKVNSALESFKDTTRLKEKLVPLLAKGLASYYDTQEDRSSEAKVSIMISYCFKDEKPILAAHFSHLGPVLQQRVKVQVSDRSRTNPVVKDSEWVRERSDLEENKPKDVNEIILVDSQGRVYEGMASNFLAVKRVAGEPVVFCAGLEHVLLGTILRLLIDICQKEGIRIQWEFPDLNEAKAGQWEGCFVTSTSRLLLPVETIYCGPDEKIEFEQVSDTVEYLRKRVLQEIANTARQIM
ncbi:hypothetical protein G6F46_004426 [Rhizopus delemar]|uniref:Zinc finger PHD-type domain-containing protein n=2 Tax=Rhizopus TaxID=4842 RepID=A0A9P7CR17_9FUNG|nr:hypothetical protein G6F43_006034 [Rhizopus delemar]KAG1545502.1 hypothetical protein G6F51_005428 [Rhizopus arrhizus]KAG1463756.1 hypothetical protein G6F55_002208 [Rhizopus delemar]KAG1499235.1 hypothetical protein G6F54_004538 [Rhizopus delemar]KAG1513015.1 hypothetical protein G6F53_004747 [Rhizopus delemar]